MFKMKKKHLLWLLIISIISCNKDCRPAELIFSFKGFSQDEVETVIVRRFSNADLHTPMDTALYEVPNISYSVQGDTLRFNRINTILPLTSGFQYEVWLPKPGILFNIMSINEEERKNDRGAFNCNKDLCVNKIQSAVVNGETLALTDWNEVYLKK